MCAVAAAGTWMGSAQDYLVRDWDLEEGLPSTVIHALARTPDGYVWLGTQQGLVRFDGVRFVTFNPENTTALRDALVTSVVTDAKGTLWAGTAKGTLTKHSQGAFSPVVPGVDMLNRKINSMVVDAGGNLWVASSAAGLIRLKDGRATNYTATNGLPSPDVWQVLADAQGRIWHVTAPGRLGWVEGDECHIVEASAHLPEGILVASPARDGGLWLAALNEKQAGTRIFRFKDGLAAEVSGAYPWPQNSERTRPGALLEDDRGNLWCGLAGGGVFLRGSDGNWRKVEAKPRDSQAEVKCLMQDEGDSVWIGTRTSGLHQAVPRWLSTLHLPESYGQHIILTVCARRDGSIWSGTDGAGVFRWQGSQMDRFGEEQGLPRAQINALLEDSEARLWAGTSQGLFLFREARFQPVTNASVRGNITVLFEDREKTLLAGTDRGLTGFGSKGEKQWDQRQGLSPGQVTAVTQDRDGSLWVAVAARGLFRQQGAQFKLWDVGRGAEPPPSRWYKGGTTRMLLPEADGSIWAGSYGYGLFRLEEGRIRWWSWHNDGLPSNHLLAFQADDAGNLWISSENGIFGYARKALLDYRGSGSLRPIPIRLGKAEGLPYKVCSGAGQPASARSADGRLWFPDGPALVSFNPTNTLRDTRIWPPIIEEVRVDGVPRPISPDNPVQVRSGARSLEFVFTSPNVLAPNRLRFRHQLEEVDKDWAVEGTQRSVKYGALSPGEYRFRVMARDSDESWNAQEAALGLVITPRLWELKWVRFATGGVVLGGLVLSVRRVERARSRRKLAAVERERALERERSRIARDIHDDLGASLTEVALLGDMAGGPGASPEELLTQTRRMSEAAHEMVQSLEAIVWAVRPENDNLRSLLDYMSRRTDELFEKMPRQYHFAMPASLPECPVHAELRHNVFLAYKEALTNALKHAQATAVRVEITCDAEVCHIQIVDNGQGFDPAAARAAGSGLRHMRQRMEEIGGGFELESRPGHGTTVRLSFPLARR